MLHAADRLDARLEAQPGEVEEAQQGLVAEVEEEVRRPGVVAVLDQLDQREAQQVLVEPDRLLDVGADQRGVVDAAARCRRRSFAGLRYFPRSSARRASSPTSSASVGIARPHSPVSDIEFNYLHRSPQVAHR